MSHWLTKEGEDPLPLAPSHKGRGYPDGANLTPPSMGK